MNRRENVVQALFMELEVLVHRAGKEPRYMSTGVATETRRRPRLSAGPATQLASLLKEPYRISVSSHVIGGYQPLVATSYHYNIETCVSHWYLLFLKHTAISFGHNALRPYNLAPELGYIFIYLLET
jgi:hypothetical protein